MSFDVSADAYDRFMGRYSATLSPQLADLAGVTAGQRAVDVGCGSGMLTAELVSRLGADAVAAIDPAELFVAAVAERNPGVDVRHGAAERLPFADDEFDVALAQLVIHFMADPVAGLREMARVTKPGGRLVVCEFSTPTVPVFSGVYKNYLMRALPALARVVSSDPESYEYLAESIRAWPTQSELAQHISSAGWSAVRWRNLTGGIVALHAAVKP